MSRRLLAINPVDHPGGAETTLLTLLARLRAHGWSASVTTPGDGPLAGMVRDAGLAHAALPVGGIGAGQGGRATVAWARARSLAAEHDTVLLNGAVCGRLLPALVPPRGIGRVAARVVLHIHDIVPRTPAFWRAADAVLADSVATARALRGIRAHVVGCPVDPDPAAASAPWPTQEGPVVGFVGRIEPRKGPLDLALAAPAIRAAVPGAHVVIVGDPPPHACDAGYAGAVSATAVTSGVERYGWQEGAPGLMRHLDVLVLPSYREPFGTVLAEAMAVGTPVVATPVDGLPEVVEDGVTGRLVPPGDPPALAAAVAEVLAQREAMGAAAARSAQRFHLDRYVEHVEGLLTR